MFRIFNILLLRNIQ